MRLAVVWAVAAAVAVMASQVACSIQDRTVTRCEYSCILRSFDTQHTCCFCHSNLSWRGRGEGSSLHLHAASLEFGDWLPKIVFLAQGLTVNQMQCLYLHVKQCDVVTTRVAGSGTFRCKCQKCFAWSNAAELRAVAPCDLQFLSEACTCMLGWSLRTALTNMQRRNIR